MKTVIWFNEYNLFAGDVLMKHTPASKNLSDCNCYEEIIIFLHCLLVKNDVHMRIQYPCRLLIFDFQWTLFFMSISEKPKRRFIMLGSSAKKRKYCKCASMLEKHSMLENLANVCKREMYDRR